MAGLSGITHKDLNDFNFEVADLLDTDVARVKDKKASSTKNTKIFKTPFPRRSAHHLCGMWSLRQSLTWR